MREYNRNNQHLDRQCAQLAIKMLVEGSADTFEHARRKAAQRLNLVGARNLPDNRELFYSLIEYQRLYDRENTAARTIKMRRAALVAMRFLAVFSPRLSGAVMHGTPFEHSPISIHLFTDEAEAIARHLLERRRPYRLAEATFRISARALEKYACYEVCHDGFDYKLVAMPYRRLNQPPLSPIDGNPVQRIDYDQLEALIAKDPGTLYACRESPYGELTAGCQ